MMEMPFRLYGAIVMALRALSMAANSGLLEMPHSFTLKFGLTLAVLIR